MTIMGYKKRHFFGFGKEKKFTVEFRNRIRYGHWTLYEVSRITSNTIKHVLTNERN